ncbi:hypothetical protein [Paenibacillus durus]|uniref:Uncharacterized protein n=1 Tax=Paenibacillus durus TaxID=44251 RepID=A0A089HPC3_PAEDU|nr:hypothetical protein [Paenibacillus durus]AIQ13851.1 hypothetical protein PDUR_19515 [Paenibacillus durus]
MAATLQQQRVNAAIVRQLPETTDLFKYSDYVQSPTLENASEFIAMVVEQHLELLGNRIIGYVAGRSGVEREGTHGLLTNASVPVVLSQVA